MDLVQHIASRNSFLAKMKTAQDRLQTLATALQHVKSQPPAPALAYYYQSYAYQRTKELSLIGKRLYDLRLELLKIDQILQLHRPRNWPPGTPYPDEFQEISRSGSEVNDQIVLDFQTFLIFTGIILDDWAHLAGCVLGAPNPTKCTFDKVVTGDGQDFFKPLWDEHKASILWLDAFPRLYRNKVIVHREKPWQLGHTRSLAFLDWSFFTPVPVGWLSDEKARELRMTLEKIAERVGADLSQNSHQLLLHAFGKIEELDKKERRTLYDLALDIGFHTPSFQQYAHRLADFLIAATDTLIRSASANPAAIHYGHFLADGAAN